MEIAGYEISAPMRVTLTQIDALSARMDGNKMTAPKLTKHELRTRETRELLLRAAEQIFIRDGYEQAELGEIATLAGRTKGAIYGHFKSKEDIFLALVEEHALRRRAMMHELLALSTSAEGNLAAMRTFFLQLVRDDTWGLVLLEFRLYTIRHPDAKERLQRVYEAIYPADEEKAYAAMLGPAGKGRGAISRAEAVHAGFSVLSALQVEAKFSSVVEKRGSAERIAAIVFDALFGLNK